MGMIILIILIFIIIGIFFAIKEREFLFVIPITFIGLLSGCLWGLVGRSCGQYLFTERITYNISTTPICAITNPTETKNSYILCIGSSKSNLYYYYWSKEKDGAKTTHNINSDKIKIYENKEENPRIETYYTHHPNPIVRFFFLTDSAQTSIYVPTGSIGYVVDLE